VTIPEFKTRVRNASHIYAFTLGYGFVRVTRKAALEWLEDSTSEDKRINESLSTNGRLWIGSNIGELIE